MAANETSVKSVSVFYYGANRASAAGAYDVLTQSWTWRDSISGTLQSMTYYDSHLC